MFVPDKPFRPSIMLHFGLLGPFISYEKMKNREYGPIFTTLYFLVSYKYTYEAEVFVTSKIFQPSEMLNFYLLSPFISYQENEMF